MLTSFSKNNGIAVALTLSIMAHAYFLFPEANKNVSSNKVQEPRRELMRIKLAPKGVNQVERNQAFLANRTLSGGSDPQKGVVVSQERHKSIPNKSKTEEERFASQEEVLRKKVAELEEVQKLLIEEKIKKNEKIDEELSKNIKAYVERARKIFAGASTTSSEMALYVEAWCEKIEASGTLFKGEESGVMEVTVEIGSKGELLRMIIERSSGNVRLDERAIEIARRAAPYGKLPVSSTDGRDVLVIKKVWRFEAGGLKRLL